MSRLNRDVYIAIFLIVFTAVFFWQSFEIKNIDYGTLQASAWPRMILVVLGILSVTYLVQSLKVGPAEETESDGLGFFERYRNPIVCFILYFLFLFSMPYLGMLIAGILFVFLLLSAIGGVTPKALIIHAIIACISIGAMWSFFTYPLGVILPPVSYTHLTLPTICSV